MSKVVLALRTHFLAKAKFGQRNRIGLNQTMKIMIEIACAAVVLPLSLFAADEFTQPSPVAVQVAEQGRAPALAPRFLGLSYETSTLLPENGRYYFDSGDQDLVRMYRTLGVKSLRIGGNSVDDTNISNPQEKDIDALFGFARAAGVKVIYSLRLKNGDPAASARTARYIADRYSDALDSISIGNEPNYYNKSFAEFFEKWKLHADAIVNAVPAAMLNGPDNSGNRAPKDLKISPLDLARAAFAGGHLAMANDHYYFLGNGRAVEKDLPAGCARFLSDDLHAEYQKYYGQVGERLAALSVPYRISEMNSCNNGGARNLSDTYASALWALDCIHWWAAHHIQGMNFHTGEKVGRDNKFSAPNYAIFLRQSDGTGFSAHPAGYAFLAFDQGAGGSSLEVKAQSASAFDFDAYAYRRNEGSISLTLINKSYGDKARPALVSIQLPSGLDTRSWQQMNLLQKSQDIAAKNEITLGGVGINAQGIWSGQWKTVKGEKGGVLTIQVAPASASILRFSPEKVAPDK
jgi:hypothetical protein